MATMEVVRMIELELLENEVRSETTSGNGSHR